MRLPRTLRGRLVVGTAAAAGLAFLVVGLIVSLAAARTERQVVDDRITQAADIAGRLGGTGLLRGIVGAGGPARLVDGTGTSLRLVRGGATVNAIGDLGDWPAPSDGIRTHEAAGVRWRVVTVPMRARRGTVQVAGSLAEADERAGALREQLVLAGVGGVGIATGLAWLVATLALGPLQRLKATAATIARTRDLSRRVDDRGPREVESLAATVNEMLARLEEAAARREEALASVRRFAAEAGHELRTPLASAEANLETLARHPGLPEDARAEVLADLRAEHARMAALMEALQALARAESRLRTSEHVDLSELLEAAVASARARHPGHDFAVTADGDAPAVVGSTAGLRAVADNLLENAARHGRPGGMVVVSCRAAGSSVVLAVEDDGPGIPPAEREAVLGRFVRGDGATGPGSGLGLAIVDEEVRRHGGTLHLEDGTLGGARVRVVLPVAPS